jgi:hypothetical protein
MERALHTDSAIEMVGTRTWVIWPHDSPAPDLTYVTALNSVAAAT